MITSRLAVSVIALALAAAAGAWGWRAGNSGEEPQYRTVAVERGPIVATVASSGTINPVASVSVGSQVSGQLREVLVDFNSEVRAGQVIARIDPETFRHRVAQAEADLVATRAQVLVQRSQVELRRAELARAKVNLDELRRDLDRKNDLVRRGFISSAERDKALSLVRAQEQELAAADAGVDVALAQVRNSEALVSQREAALAASRVDLARTTIRSPVDGVVIKRSVDAGQTVAASLQAPELFVIARNLSDMQVDTSIDETDIGRIKTGQQASFAVDAYPGRRFEGKVSQVRMAATNVQNVITYNVIVRFSNAEGLLLPGMTASVKVVTDTRDDVLKVPNAALRLRIAGLTDAADDGGAGGAAAGSSTASSSASSKGSESKAPVDRREGPGGSRGDASGSRGDAQVRSSQVPSMGRIWVIDARRPRMVEVRVGASDGLMTEVSAPELNEGAEVIVGTAPVAEDRRRSGLRMF